MDTPRMADERKRRLLLVEDDSAVSEALVDLLAMLEHQADAAASGAKALELFERHRYDLVLTDLMMPGMTGWEVLAAVRGRDARIPVIVISGSTVVARETGLTRLRRSPPRPLRWRAPRRLSAPAPRGSARAGGRWLSAAPRASRPRAGRARDSATNQRGRTRGRLRGGHQP